MQKKKDTMHLVDSTQPPMPPKESIFSYSLSLANRSTTFLKVEDPQEIFSTAHSYFLTMLERNTAPTATGLAMKLGMTKTELLALRSEPTPQGMAINTAISVVVDMVERQLLSSKAGHPGLIFWLKNIDDWADKREIAHSGDVSLAQLFNAAQEDDEEDTAHPENEAA